MKHTCAILCLLFAARVVMAQAPGVPVYNEGRGARQNAALQEQAKKLQAASALLPMAKVEEQAKRNECILDLPQADTKVLTSRERWQRARLSHIRVGAFFLCSKCDRWHLDLAGGYAITADGAVATCAHVIAPPEGMKEGWLVAANEDDELLPVTEVLACNMGTDSAIVRVKSSKPLTPVPLSLDVSPGDQVWCFSDPNGKRGYFSDGIVSRFVKRPFISKKDAGKLPEGGVLPRPVWLETTTEWAPGSSGSAVIDQFGNGVGHVSEIQSVLEDPLPARKKKDGKEVARPQGTLIIFHQAIAAGEVLALVKKP
ncbi:MAG: S1 family peptidase [Prosthecobacter sp.]